MSNGNGRKASSSESLSASTIPTNSIEPRTTAQRRRGYIRASRLDGRAPEVAGATRTHPFGEQYALRIAERTRRPGRGSPVAWHGRAQGGPPGAGRPRPDAAPSPPGVAQYVVAIDQIR